LALFVVKNYQGSVHDNEQTIIAWNVNYLEICAPLYCQFEIEPAMCEDKEWVAR